MIRTASYGIYIYQSNCDDNFNDYFLSFPLQLCEQNKLIFSLHERVGRVHSYAVRTRSDASSKERNPSKK